MNHMWVPEEAKQPSMSQDKDQIRFIDTVKNSINITQTA